MWLNNGKRRVMSASWEQPRAWAPRKINKHRSKYGIIIINVMFASWEELRGVHQLRRTLKDEGICADCGPVVHPPSHPPISDPLCCKLYQENPPKSTKKWAALSKANWKGSVCVFITPVQDLKMEIGLPLFLWCKLTLKFRSEAEKRNYDKTGALQALLPHTINIKWAVDKRAPRVESSED